MMKATTILLIALVALLVNCADAAGKGRYLRIAGDSNNNEININSLTSDMDAVTLNRIKQQYLMESGVHNRYFRQDKSRPRTKVQ